MCIPLFSISIYTKYIHLHIHAICRLIYTHTYSLYVHIYLPIHTHMCMLICNFQFNSVQSLSCVRLFATPWIAAHQASLSITNSWSSLKLMSIESVMPSSHLILCRPLLPLPPIPPSIRVFSNSQLFAWGGQSTGVSALASVLPMNTQDWSPFGWTGWISLQSKGLSRVFSNTTVLLHWAYWLTSW